MKCPKVYKKGAFGNSRFAHRFEKLEKKTLPMKRKR